MPLVVPTRLPRCTRCLRITDQQTIFLGSASRSVYRRACVLNSPCGSRIRTQHTGTAGKPVEYHTAEAEAISTVRCPLSYQLAILVGFQTVFGSLPTTDGLAAARPLCAASPFGPGVVAEPARRG